MQELNAGDKDSFVEHFKARTMGAGNQGCGSNSITRSGNYCATRLSQGQDTVSLLSVFTMMSPFFPRLLLHLPPSVLMGSPQTRQPVSPNCEEFFSLVNSELVCENALGWPFYLCVGFMLTLNCFTEKLVLPWQCPDP